MKCGYIILVCLFVGCSTKSPPAAISPSQPQPVASPAEVAVVDLAAEALANPVAKQLFADAALSKTAELSVSVTRGSERIVIEGKKKFSNDSPAEMAEAREALAMLLQARLLTNSRTINDGAGMETTVYSLTTKGHAAAKKMNLR
jgi:hypothetical protein